MSSQIPHFPRFHVRPERGWVNDPNGIGHWDRRWHVMYQWNPHAPQHRDVHWGHMSSPDLLSWHDEGVALQPRPGRIDAAGVWSGVAVADSGTVALVYTAVPDHAHNAGVAVARRRADGTWVQPDVTATRHPDHDWVEVRDPFLVRVGGRRLGVMGAGRPRPTADPADGRRPRRGAVLVYDATDLDRWTLLGALLVADELPDDMVGAGAIWECPQLLPLADRWLLVVSWDDGPTSRRQGVTAFVGDLDLSASVPRFVPSTETALDNGPDFYAPQVVADGDRLLAWAWSWEGRGTGTNHRADDEVEASGWAGTLTFPREIVLDASGRARCVPARELALLTGDTLAVEVVDDSWSLQTHEPAWMFSTENSGAGAIQLDLVHESTGASRPVWNDSQLGDTQVLIDGSIVEVFTSAGSATVRAYPAAGEAWRVVSASPLRAATLRSIN